ncbi:hypothetical protein BT67DRAFT_173948 [Trichocladium antarcticum]|uniref:Uncharacterized protein n=1 Tax=Trichocladium antarcticum TaxID=1450529 RepID=A0AAN6ZG70_9PEZI|nr:hypothetical protein BT67DRAFT_173948 [Trichocladium antarcticum]
MPMLRIRGCNHMLPKQGSCKPCLLPFLSAPFLDAVGATIRVFRGMPRLSRPDGRNGEAESFPPPVLTANKRSRVSLTHPPPLVLPVRGARLPSNNPPTPLLQSQAGQSARTLPSLRRYLRERPQFD